jgi:23S rRNA (uracil1939-C5)-methyltransferase
MKIGEKLKVNIETVVNGGKGLARVEDFVLFIEGALPGEYIEVEIIKLKKKYGFAKILNILSQSIGRQKPDCKYYKICGGCQLQHCKYNFQLEIKENIAKEMFEVFTKDIHKIEPSVNEFNYRNKVSFRKNPYKAGLLSSKSHAVVDVEQCMIANKKINYFFSVIKNSKSNSGTVKFILKTTENGEIMLVADKEIKLDEYTLKSFDSVYMNNKHISGKKFLTQSIEGVDFRIYPKSFFQINFDVLKKIINFLKAECKGNVLLDSYCGTGIFSFALRNNFSKIIGIDIEIDSIKSANIIKKSFNINNTEFYTGKVKNMIESFSKADYILLDPPRKGCSTKVIEGLLESGVPNIIYISCDPSTLRRDLKILEDKYKVDKIKLYDMFPQTFHFETIAILKKL